MAGRVRRARPLLPVKMIVSFSEQCPFTLREFSSLPPPALPAPPLPPPPPHKKEKAFGEFVFSGLTQKELYVYFLSGLWTVVSIYHTSPSPPTHWPPSLFYSENLNFIKLFLTTTTCLQRAQGVGEGDLGCEETLQGAQ